MATDPIIYALAHVIPGKEQGRPGPERAYGELLFVLYMALTGAVGSHRRAARILGHPDHWIATRTAASQRGFALPAQPPRRWNCEDARRRVLRVQGRQTPDTGLTEILRARAAALWCERAHKHGALAGGTRSNVDPARGNTVYGDGKVTSSMFGPKARRARRAAGLQVDGSTHVQGGDNGTSTHGLKFMHVGVRPNDRPNSRLILDMRYVPHSGYGGEAGIAVDALLDLAAREPGATTLCYDGALRGTHLQALADAGYLVFSPPHGSTAKPHALETVTSCACGDTHRLMTVDGYVAERVITDTGTTTDVRCTLLKLSANRRQNSYAWYLEVELSCGNLRRFRVNKPSPDGPLRIERLRQAAKDESDDSAVYNRIYGRREDAESVNNILERTLHGGRSISPSAIGQFLVMLGHALARNAYTELLWQRDHAESPPPIAA
ncbi:hypothetical protein [Gordonia sp. (in: high G+C Gram-positive bacteria)]|uniref:hypothetical protein n=1 Tax=Gordonia sp. (in: high G+C Gram-positive bacteria) TaxID=84139 RepID=UPI00334099BE